MPAPDLTPQVPGEQPVTTIPTANDVHPGEALEALAGGNAEQVVAALPGLSGDDLSALAVIESEARNRVTVLRAISAELAARDGAGVDGAAAMPAEPALPARFGHAILTPQGWLVPEPHQRAGAKA